jgi:1-acyl-sn-glycerol-3-phosphate acyltransferase
LKSIGRIGAIWFVFWFAISFIVMYPFFALFLSKEAWYPKANKLRKVWAWFLVVINFVKVKRLQETALPKGPAIYVSNHSSYIDIIAFGLFFPEKGCFMAKKELAKIPLFGIFFRTIDIAVDRSSAIGSHKSFVTAAERIKAGYSIILFPEGTIWKFAPRLKTFKNGAFKLAIDNHVPIVPVTFYNNYKILPDEKFEFYAQPMTYKIHRVETTNHLKGEDANGLRDKIFAIIEKELNQNLS